MGIISDYFQYFLDRQPIKGRYLIVKLNGINYTNNNINNTNKKNLKFQSLIVTNDETGIYTEFFTFTK